GRALSSLAMYCALQGERVAIGPVAEESVAILRETAGPSVDLVCALVALGQSRLLAGDLVGAARVLAEALGVARAVRPHYWITYALYWQGCVAQASGDLAAARAAFDEGVALALEDGYNAPIAHLATMRGRLALAWWRGARWARTSPPCEGEPASHGGEVRDGRDEEPLVHDHPGGRPGTDRSRSGR